MHRVTSFAVVESHPDNALEDLRLDKPFPELSEHIQSYDLDHMDKKVGTWFTLWSLRQVQAQNGFYENAFQQITFLVMHLI